MKNPTLSVRLFSGRARLGNARSTWTRREGVVVALGEPATGGPVGWGEASPLPGWSRDDLGEVAATLTAGPLGTPAAELPPSLRFALETAAADLAARRAGRSLAAELAGGGRVRSGLPTARLVDLFDAETSIGEAEAEIVKVKIGRAGRFAEEVEALHRLRDRLGRDVALRLDANRGLDPGRLAEQLGMLAALDPELLEDPVAWKHWPGASPVPLGLDEVLGREWLGRPVGELREILAPTVAGGALDALVLKPAFVGGIGRSRELADLAADLGLGVVVSHLFDGPIALAAASALALALPGDVRPAGLAPHAGLAAWPTAPSPWCAAGRLVVPPGPGLGFDPGDWFGQGEVLP